MKISQRIQTAVRAFTTSTSEERSFGSVMRNYGTRSKFRPQEQLTGITYKAIDKIGLSVSDYKIQVFKANGDPYANHPIINLQKNPNPNQTASDFTHLWAMMTEIYGETFWYKVRGVNSNKVKELYLLNPSQMEVKVYDGEVVGYVLHKNDGNQVPFMPEEIKHDKRPNPFNELRGMSVLEKASVYVDTEITTSQFTLSYIKNNASPSGIVSLPSMDKETFKQFAQQWREGYEGPQNAGKTAFIRGGEAQFQAVGATLKDVDQKITREMAKEDVLMMFDMPKGMLGMDNGNGLGRAGVETLNYIFASEKLEPMMKRLDLIYESFIPEVAPGTAVTVSHTSPVPLDKDYTLNTYKEGVNKWLTPNEIRAEQGLDPIDGGDILAPVKEAPEKEPAKSASKKLVLKKPVTKSEQLKNTKAEQEAFRAQLVETSDLYAEEVKSGIAKFALEQENKVIANIGASKKDANSDWLFNVKEETVLLALVLTPIIIELMETQRAEAANFITGEAVALSESAKQTIEKEVLKLSADYNADTVKAIQTTLAEGQANNETVLQLKKRIEATYADAKGYRAERIARTESLRASNESAMQIYFENGYSKTKWFYNPGACEFCVTMGNTVSEIGSNFKSVGDVLTTDKGNQMRIEYRDITTPPLHPNCKCSITPVS
jgi:HK97 family phage portal protein